MNDGDTATIAAKKGNCIEIKRPPGSSCL